VLLVRRGAPISTRGVGCGLTSVGEGIPAADAIGEMHSGGEINSLGSCLE